MGKGDKKTKRGKIRAASHGIARSHKRPKPAKREKIVIEVKEESKKEIKVAAKQNPATSSEPQAKTESAEPTARVAEG